jgi:hypothetical protein
LSYCLMSWERNEISLPLNQQTLRYGRNLNDVICPLLKLNPIIMSLSKWCFSLHRCHMVAFCPW